MRLDISNSTDWTASISGYGETVLAPAESALICGEYGGKDMGRKTDRITSTLTPNAPSVLSGGLRLSDKRITATSPHHKEFYGDLVALPGLVASAGEDAT